MKIVDEKSKLLGIIDTGLKLRFELLYSASACELCELCELHGLIYANSFKIWMSSFLRNNFVSKNISNLMWIIQTTQNVWTYVFRSENIWLQNATIQLYRFGLEQWALSQNEVIPFCWVAHSLRHTLHFLNSQFYAVQNVRQFIVSVSSLLCSFLFWISTNKMV